MDYIGEPSDNRLFVYNVTEQGDHTFTMQKSDRTLIQDDKLSNASVGPHYFFFQVSGTGFNNSQLTTRITAPLAAGTYPWQIRDANGVIVLQGTMVI